MSSLRLILRYLPHLGIGGSLITPDIVLTAAHCIASIQSAEIGRYDYNAVESGVETYVNLERRRHPLFDALTYDYDYALIKLEREQPSPFLVSLRKTPEMPDQLTIMGWGLTSDGGKQPNELLEADVLRFNTTRCRSNYEPDPVTDNMFCAGYVGVDACQGDSGGPIIITGTNIQVGITSWGSGCATASFPGVYARIDTGYSWIEETICTDLSPDYCSADGKLPVVNSEGVPQEPSCQDQDEFTGLGKKLLLRNCTWVQEGLDRRCPWYGEDFCPETCKVDRCKA